METLIDLLESSASRYRDRNALGLRRDDGTTFHWSYREVLRRSRIAAWRLRALGLQPGDRVLTWSPSMPALPAAYFGAMYARLIFVPLDARVARRDGPSGSSSRSGADASAPRAPGVTLRTHARSAWSSFPTTAVEDAVGGPGRDVSGRLGGAARRVATAGAGRGVRAGVHVRHDRQPQGRDARPRQRARRRPVVPRDHQSHGAPDGVAAAPVALAGAGRIAVLRDGRGRGHPLRAQPRTRGSSSTPSGITRVTTMLLVPQLLDLFWSAIEREVARQGRTATFDRLRRIARRLPYRGPPAPVPSVHPPLGGGLRLFASAGAFLPPALQQAWEDLGVIVLQGYGATETAAGCVHDDGRPPAGHGGLAAQAGRDADRRRRRDPVPGPDPVPGVLARPRGDGRRRIPTTAGTGRATSAGSTSEAGSTSTAGRRTSSSCPTASTCYPEDIENALRVAGIRDSVAIETATRAGSRPSCSRPGSHGLPGGAAPPDRRSTAAPAEMRSGATSTPRSRRPTRRSGRTSGSRAGGCGPTPDFPRTHTLKVKRDRGASLGRGRRAATGAGGRGRRRRLSVPARRTARGPVSASPTRASVAIASCARTRGPGDRRRVRVVHERLSDRRSTNWASDGYWIRPRARSRGSATKIAAALDPPRRSEGSS